MNTKPKLEILKHEDLGSGRVRLLGRFDFGTGLPRTMTHPMMKDMVAEIAAAMASDCVRRGGTMTLKSDGDIIDIEVTEPAKAKS